MISVIIFVLGQIERFVFFNGFEYKRLSVSRRLHQQNFDKNNKFRRRIEINNLSQLQDIHATHSDDFN